MKKITRIIICLLIASILWSATPALNQQLINADSQILKWNRLQTPGSTNWKNDVISPCEVNRIAIGNDGKTFYAVDIVNASNITGANALYRSENAGISWDDNPGIRLFQHMTFAERANFRVWDIVTSREDVNTIAVVTNTALSTMPGNVWVSLDGGINWHDTLYPAIATISSIDITGSLYDVIIVVGTRTGIGTGTLQILSGSTTKNWTPQAFTGDVMSLKFSHNYNSDNTIIVLYADMSGTFLNAGYHDITDNILYWNSIYINPIEITENGTGSSPRADQIINADLDIPRDFNGQSPSYRRYYVSIDSPVNSAGIFRIDDDVVYQLMNATVDRRISSIAYYGSYSSGKLLAGEVLGNPCEATVMTWFTDAPMVCPVTCWYPAKKPPTGGAGDITCAGSGYGNAQIAWSPDGENAYAGTATTAPLIPGINWPIPYLTGQNQDESAFSRSFNNGATWNQISLIDTRIDRYIDIAPLPGCSYLFLASINTGANCAGFDSVWRTSDTIEGYSWERILCKPTSSQPCAAAQSDDAILNLAGDKANGQSIFWAARNSNSIYWSLDNGDFWFMINSRLRIQDFVAEDSKNLYILESSGRVQRLHYSGSGWTSSPTAESGLSSAYSIATAFTETTPDNPMGIVIIGGTDTSNFDIAFSTDSASNFTVIPKELPTKGNTGVMASSSFTSDGTILAINSGGMYAWSIYSGVNEWEIWWGGPDWPSPITSFAISRNYSLYFNTPASLWSPATPYIRWSAATANLDAAISLGNGAVPDRRLKICGGVKIGDPIIVYVIDQRNFNPPDGGVWFYIDTLVWEGPLLTLPISFSPVDHDTVTGRASEINLTWNPVSLSRGYRIQIAKDFDFSQVIIDIGRDFFGPFYVPFDFDNPAMIIFPGGGIITDAVGTTWQVTSLEAGHVYYWRVRTQDVLTGDQIKSTWSWKEAFIVKQGLPVASRFLGPQILQPADNCQWACNTPVCFSWTPIINTTKYRLILSSNADMSDPLINIVITGTGYQYSGELISNNTYFWRVKAEEPYDGEWSATSCFKIVDLK